MSLLTSLFTGRWTARINRYKVSQARLWRNRRTDLGASTSATRRSSHLGRPFEQLEPRLALSVTTIPREIIVEEFFPNNAAGDKEPVGEQPGQLVVAADQGSDVYLQKIDMTPEELLVADNGSFLDYMAIENVDGRFDEFIVTNGAEHLHEAAITADQWWLFPTKTNDNAVSPTDDPLSTANLTTTRLALDRPEVVIGPGRDFFGSVYYMQSDGTLTTWTFSAWDGSGNGAGDFVSQFGEALYITSGPGFGGGPYSFKNTLIAPTQSLVPGHIFPRKISVVTEQLPENLQTGPGGTKQFGGRRHYLEVEWSQTPVLPPVMEANYWGASHYVNGVPQNVRDPLSTDEDVPPTVGVAMRTTDLRVTIPRAITEGSPDGSPSLGIIPGTTSGTLVIGGVGQEEIYRMTFEDRKNTFPEEDRRNDEQNPVLNDRFTFFFDDYDNSGAVGARRTFGLIEGEIETNIIKDIDWRFREEAVRTHTYLEGEVVDASVLQFGIGSHVNDATRDLDRLNQLYGDNNLNDSFRALEGINVIISEANLLDGTARDAVRVEDLNYHVYVKPAVPNEVYFTAAADFTRAVTVDLLTEGSSVYVNSPIRVADPAGDIDLRATNVIVNAPLETDDYLILGRSNSEESPRLPRLSDPQGGELSTPTFLGSLLTDETTTRTVAPTPVLDGYGVGTLDVLPGREGYGYDPARPPLVTIEPAPILDATVQVAQVAGGVGELLLDDVGSVNEQLNLLGVDGLEYLDIEFGTPDLRVVESVNRWTLIQNELTGLYDPVPAPEGYFAAPVIAISPPEIIGSATRIGYGEIASVTPDNEWGNGVRSVNLVSGGSNYSARPSVTLKSNSGWDFWDPRVPVEYRSFPDFSFDFDLQIEPITGPNGQQTGARYVSGTIRSLTLLNNGFGLNIENEQQLLDNYYFEVSGGYNPNLTDNGFPVTGIPPADQITHAVVLPEEALLGTLAWKGSSLNDQVTPNITEDPLDPRLRYGANGELPSARLLSTLLNSGETYTGPRTEIDKLEDRGLHYELSPDVQFIGQLRADVSLEFRVDEDDDGDTGVSGDIVYGDQVVIDGGKTQNDKQFYRASLENVFAFADGTENFPFSKGKFRDVDYLSYLNSREKLVSNGSEPIGADKVVTAHASVDGQNWFRVVPVKSDSLENFYWPAKALEGSKEIVLRDGFVNWHYLQPGMTITLPSSGPDKPQEVKVVQWFENTSTIAVDAVIKEGFTETDDVGADFVLGLGPSEQPRGIRFGGKRNIIDVYRQQFSFRKVDYGVDEYYWAEPGQNGTYTRTYTEDVDRALGLVVDNDELSKIEPMKAKYFRLFMDPWFEVVSLDADGERTDAETGRLSGAVDSELKAFASMGYDPARGRAVLSGEVGSREITNLEITHPGSGYIKTPTVTFTARPDGEPGTAIPAGDAAARAIVTGGIYELKVTEAGFNYFGDTLPGLAAEVVRNVNIPVFDIEDLPAGARLPTADFIARNTSIRGGQIADPGAGLKIIGPAGSEELGGFDQGDLVLEPGEGLALDPAVFQAIVEPDGRILRFEKLRSGTGYRIAPIATVESPLPPRSATAYASINSSLGTVSHIDVLDEGYRYAVAPRVYVLPPTPRGEGRAATAVSVLGPSGEVIRIDITDPGSGYTSPPVVLVQEVDAYNVVENVDIAAHISANKYEWYVSRNVWTDRERGSVLMRPTNTLGYSPPAGGATAEWIYIEAAATDITFEGDVDATDVTVLMNSRVEDQPFAPYEFTTLSTATGTQSGTINADQLVVTMGNDVPTPLSGGSLVNKVALQTAVRTLRATAAVSQRNPRGAFPYDIEIVQPSGDLLVEAVARSSGEIAFNVPDDLQVKAGILTDGDISITTTKFNQTTPLETEFGAISIVAEDIDVLNSVLVKAAPLDERNSDISLHATSGSIDLVGTVSSPNSIYLRQQGIGGLVGGNTRLRTQELRIEAEGTVDIFTDVDVAFGSSDFGDFTINELNDVSIPTLQVPNGVVRLTANGVDRGGNAINPIALSARIVEGQELFASTPNGSMDVDVDTSSDLALGVLADLASNPNTTPMLAAGSVQIVNASGSVDVYDGPVAGQNATIVKAASTARLPNIHAYSANTPGEFPSELSGPGAFPLMAFGGVGSIRVGDYVLLKDQFDRPETGRFDESRENGVYEVMRLGGGDSGFQDWLLRRSVDADSRPDLLPGSYVRVREGEHRGEIFQVQYSVLPSLGVTRTINNQLVVDAGVGGLLAVDVNDVVTGYGIVPGARVTGVDYTNGVVTLGVGNGYVVTDVVEDVNGDGAEGTVEIAADQSLLFDSLRYAQARGERALISGHWFKVGAEITDWDEASSRLTVRVPVNRSNNVWASGIRAGAGSTVAPEGARAVVGFSTAATDRVSLNPAVRTFLINSIEDEASYGVESTRTIDGEDTDADLQSDYTRVLNPTTLGRSRNTIDVLKTAVEGWTIRVGDEITYTITDRSGRTVDHINRVVSVVDGNSTSQDEVASGLFRIGLAEPSLGPTYLGDDLGYRLPALTLRNRSRVAPENPGAVDWDALHVGMQLDAVGASDRTTKFVGDGVRLPDGSAYRYELDRGFQVYGRLSLGMTVTGESVPPGTTLLGFDAENGTVDLNSRLFDIETPVTFGERFTTLVDWNKTENYLAFSDELETTDFSVELGFTVESFDIRDEVKVTEPGSGYPRDTDQKVEAYFDAPNVPVGEGGIQMEGYAVPDGNGGIKRVVITRQGAGYDATPNVYVAQPSVGERAEAEVTLNKGSLYKSSNDGPAVEGRFEFLDVVEFPKDPITGEKLRTGSGYTTNSDVQIGVTFSLPDRAIEDGAVQMEGYAKPDGQGGIEEIVVTQKGFGYVNAPSVTVDSPANPAGVAAEPQVPFTAGGEKVLVAFSEPDTPDGVRIRGYAVPDGLGGIRQIVVTEPGSGYRTPPTATVDASPLGGVRAQAKISTGLGYSTDPDFRVGVEFSKPDTLTGVQMLGYAVPDGAGGIEKVVITQQGRGYAKTPTVTIEPPLNPSRELLGLRAAGVVDFTPTYVDQVVLQNLLGGSDSALSMTPNFTNYDGLRAGQPVFGGGVKPGTVITRVLPGVRRVEVTPGGLPVRLTVEDDPAVPGDEMQVRLQRSEYYTDGFAHVLQMPRTFNEFHALNVGQRVRFPGGEWAETVITAIDPVYRQIGIQPPEAHILEALGLDSVSVVDPIAIGKVVFDSLDRVEFGMIDRTGTGTASFSVTPFGYEAITMATPAVASGLASLKRADESIGAYEIELISIDDEQRVISGRRISGIGLRPGYRIENFDGRNLRLYSAGVDYLETVQVEEQDTYTYRVDEAFSAWASISGGMKVTGEGVPENTSILSVDPAQGTITVNQELPQPTFDGEEKVLPKVTFGNPFAEKWLAQGVGSEALSGVSIHLEQNDVSSVIAAGNIRDEVRYQVSTNGGTNRTAGSLGRIMLVSQRNEYHADDGLFAGGAGVQPVVRFADSLSQIELSEPLPPITTNAITIDGTRQSGSNVEVVGRFINRTESGDTVLSTTVVDGFVIEGAGSSGTVLKNMQIGGFNNGSAVRVDGAANTLISDMVIGVTGAQIRSASRFGVLVTGGADAATIQNTEIVSSEQAGIRIDDGATKTKIVGVTLGADYGSRTTPDYFWNETGIEVVADDVQLGLEPLRWKSSGVYEDQDGSFYEKAIAVGATLTAGSQVVELALQDEMWPDLAAGLAVIGVGLVDSTFIQSVDTANRRVILSKAATRTVDAATVLIGYQAVGKAGGVELELAAGVPIDQVFPGQSLKVVSGLNRSQVFDTTVLRVDSAKRLLYVADPIPNAGMYEKSIHLLDFGTPNSNVIQYSRNGIVVGLAGLVSADPTRDSRLLTVAQGFTGWSSLRKDMDLVVRDEQGELFQSTVVDWDEERRTITVANDISRSFLLKPVRFGTADGFHMINTTIQESIEDGLVIGGGTEHVIGSAAHSGVYATREEAEEARQVTQRSFELASYKTVTSISSLGDLLVADLSVRAWLEAEFSERPVTVFGAGVPDGSTVGSFNNGVVTLDIPSESIGQLSEVNNTTVYFGLGVFVTAEPGAIRQGDQVDGQGGVVNGETKTYEFLSVEHIREPVLDGEVVPGNLEVSGFIALSSPRDGLLGVGGRGRMPDVGDAIVFADREQANVLANNSGFGISVIDTLATTDLYDAIRSSWSITGNLIDISYDRGSNSWLYRPNTRGPLSPLLFAQVFSEAETFSNFDRTDSYGNQYALERAITESNEPDDPFGGSTGGGTGSGGDGSGSTGGGGADDPFDPGVGF